MADSSPAIRRNGFYRSPAQVLLLSYASFGIYNIYYFLRARRLAQRRLSEPEETYWTGFKLIIPIYGIYYYFAGWNKICERVRSAGINPLVPFGAQAIPMFIIDLLWRLPDPYWMVSTLSTFFLGTIHASVAHAERLDEPDYKWPRLNWAEWAIIVIGWLFIALAMIGYATDAAITQFLSVVFGLMVLNVVVFYLAYRSLSRPTTVVPMEPAAP